MIKKHIVIFAVFLMIIILIADFFTGREVRLIYLLILPVSMFSLYDKVRYAYAFSVILPFFRLIFFLKWNEEQNMLIGLINALIRMLVFLFISYSFNKVKLYKDLKYKLEHEKLQTHICNLESILPICSSCKKIRNANGDYQPVESYLKINNDINFTHTLCPECMKKLYPEYINNS